MLIYVFLYFFLLFLNKNLNILCIIKNISCYNSFQIIFIRFSPLATPQILYHETSPLQTIYDRKTPKITATFTHFSPWQLHRSHIIRPRHCKPSTVGRYQKLYLFSSVFPPLGNSTEYISLGLTITNYLW